MENERNECLWDIFKNNCAQVFKDIKSCFYCENISENKSSDLETLNQIEIINRQIKNLEKEKQDSAKKIKELELEIKNSKKSLEQEKQNKNSNKNNYLNNELKQEKDKLIKAQKRIEQLESELKKDPQPQIVQLNNIGATCYMNATLQSLSNTKPLTEYFLNKYKPNQKNIMSYEYYKLEKHLWDKKNNNKPYSPYSFKEVLSKENPLFAGIQANDSKDLINFLLERFHQDLNETKENIINNNNNLQQDQTNEQGMLNLFFQDFKRNFNSPISNIFYGIIETKSQCHGCQIIKYNFQVYSFLEFPLQEVNKYCCNKGKRQLYNSDGSNPDVDLYECFEYYSKVDLMTGENQMYCNICKKLCNAFNGRDGNEQYFNR